MLNYQRDPKGSSFAFLMFNPKTWDFNLSFLSISGIYILKMSSIFSVYSQLWIFRKQHLLDIKLCIDNIMAPRACVILSCSKDKASISFWCPGGKKSRHADIFPLGDSGKYWESTTFKHILAKQYWTLLDLTWLNPIIPKSTKYDQHDVYVQSGSSLNFWNVALAEWFQYVDGTWNRVPEPCIPLVPSPHKERNTQGRKSTSPAMSSVFPMENIVFCLPLFI